MLIAHRWCLGGNSNLIDILVVTDFLIGLAYWVISYICFKLAQRLGRLSSGWMLWAFGMFIVSCGIGHWIDVLTLWVPVYQLTAVNRLTTAIASVGTAIALGKIYWNLSPQVNL